MKGCTKLYDDIAITKPIRRMNRSSITVSRQRVQCYDATDGTAFWHSAEACLLFG